MRTDQNSVQAALRKRWPKSAVPCFPDLCVSVSALLASTVLLAFGIAKLIGFIGLRGDQLWLLVFTGALEIGLGLRLLWRPRSWLSWVLVCSIVIAILIYRFVWNGARCNCAGSLMSDQLVIDIGLYTLIVSCGSATLLGSSRLRLRREDWQFSPLLGCLLIPILSVGAYVAFGQVAPSVVEAKILATSQGANGSSYYVVAIINRGETAIETLGFQASCPCLTSSAERMTVPARSVAMTSLTLGKVGVDAGSTFDAGFFLSEHLPLLRFTIP